MPTALLEVNGEIQGPDDGWECTSYTFQCIFPDENIGTSSKGLPTNSEDISPLLESLRSGGGGGRKEGQKDSHDKVSTCKVISILRVIKYSK